MSVKKMCVTELLTENYEKVHLFADVVRSK